MQLIAPRAVFGIVNLEVRVSLSVFHTQCLSQGAGFKPDVYFKPQEVWEIRGAE